MDLTVRIKEVAENAGSCRADFQTGRVLSFTSSMQTKSAFLYHTLRPDSIAQVTLVGIDLIWLQFGFLEIEPSCIVGTGGHAVTTANAPVVIDHDNTVGFLPGGFDWAGLGAGGFTTLMTLDRHVELVLVGHLMVVIGRALFQVDRSFLKFQDFDIGHFNVVVALP